MREKIATIVFMTSFCMMLYPVLVLGLHFAGGYVLEWWQPIVGIVGLTIFFVAPMVGVYGENK